MMTSGRDPLHARILQAEARYGLLAGGRRVLVALSGGQDSVALLHALLTMPEVQAEVAALHVHHGMRGAEADADERTVRETCAELGVECFVARRDVPAEAAAAGVGVELAGRRARYEEYERVAREHGFDRIATAHTATDRAETLLLNLLRGAGLRGLAGIPPRRGRVVRPLIFASRAETGEYCRRHGLPVCTDATNLDADHARRNALRLTILPLIEEHFPGAEAALVRACEAIEEELAWTQPLVARLVAEFTEAREDGGVDLRVAGLEELPTGLLHRVLMGVLEQARGGLDGIGREHVERVAELALSGSTGATVALPGPWQARREYGRVHLEPAQTETAPPADEEEPLPVPGKALLPERGWLVCAEPGVAPDDLTTGGPLVAWIDAAAAARGLVLRNVRPGDRFIPLGMSGSRKLQDLFVDDKVPRRERARAAVVADARGQILWVVGHRLAEPARATSGAAAVRLTARRCDDACGGTEEDV